MNIPHEALRKALFARAFELKLLDLFKENRLSGTVHTCVGQELATALLYGHVDASLDAAFSNHRCHGHFLSYGGPADGLLAEIMGREGALCLGRGGSQHIHYKRFFSNGIQGGMTPVAVGFALARRRAGDEAVAVCHIGDGTLGEGVLYEAFTFAALYQAPVLFYLEDNGWAQSTPTSSTTPGDVEARVRGFGIEVRSDDDEDPERLHGRLGEALEHVRRGAPLVQIVKTRRLCAHSKGDDTRPPELVAELWERDPLANLIRDDARCAGLFDEAREAVDALAREVDARPVLRRGPGRACDEPDSRAVGSLELTAEPGRCKGRVVELLNAGLGGIMERDPRVLVLGEDIADPYGGAFKVTRGLTGRFPDRIVPTPIAEAGLTGVGNGLALGGMRPVVEIMFSDFSTLIADQMVNHAAKFQYMYGGDVSCPLTVRLASGGGRGYGPTHSQCMETLFMGVPGVRVVSLSARHDPGRLLELVVEEGAGPDIFVENKRLYAGGTETRPPEGYEPRGIQGSSRSLPPLRYAPLDGIRPELTLVTYGGMTGVVEDALRMLAFEHEIFVDYFVLTQVWPLPSEAVRKSVESTGALLVVEEGPAAFNAAGGIAAEVASGLGAKIACVGAEPVPIPCSKPLENQALPDAGDVCRGVLELLNR